ncbi:MAG: ribonuclease III [Leptospira sp.]|nr:ribonuclease III [Leptospira sp.]
MRKRRSEFNNPLANIKPDRLKQLEKLQKQLHIHFQDITILNTAFTHRSYANEAKYHTDDNERLEFLGDSVLGLIAAETLFSEMDNKAEGILAKSKSKLVSGPVLTKICLDARLIEYLQFGKGEEDTGKKNPRVMENLVEALLGAIYLDQGLESCKKFIMPYLQQAIGMLGEIESVKDYKSLLQEKSQRIFKQTPRYELISEVGLDHDKIFTIKVSLPNGLVQNGEGKNKRSAEHNAAKNIMKIWKEND